MNVILRGGPHDGEIRRGFTRNTFGCSTVTEITNTKTGKVECTEDYYESTSEYERDQTRPRAKFNVFRFKETRPCKVPKLSRSGRPVAELS